MLFNPISPLVRIKYYSDSERGYGDSGTFKYVKVSPNDFDEIINKRYDGSTYTTYQAKDELYKRLEAVGYNGYGMGMDFATKKEYNAELKRVREYLERLENISII